MCSPILDATSAVMQGISDNKTAKQQARVLEYEGKAALTKGNYDAVQVRDQGRQVQGSNTVATAHGNADVTSGSALEIAMKNARDNEMDALLTIHGGQTTNWSKQFEAKQARYQGKMALINSGIKAVSTISKAAEKAVTAGAGGG